MLTLLRGTEFEYLKDIRIYYGVVILGEFVLETPLDCFHALLWSLRGMPRLRFGAAKDE